MRFTLELATRREPASEDIGRQTEETPKKISKFSICGSNHRNRFWFSVLLAWLALASALYTVFAEDWTNFGGSVIKSFSCDVIDVDIISYLEAIPGWSIIVSLDMSLFDDSYPTEDVETVEDYFIFKQEEINAADESFCNGVANIAILQLVTMAFFLVAAVLLFWASFSPELGIKCASSVGLGRAGGIVVILGMLMQIAVCVIVAYMVNRVQEYDPDIGRGSMFNAAIASIIFSVLFDFYIGYYTTHAGTGRAYWHGMNSDEGAIIADIVKLVNKPWNSGSKPPAGEESGVDPELGNPKPDEQETGTTSKKLGQDDVKNSGKQGETGNNECDTNNEEKKTTT